MKASKMAAAAANNNQVADETGVAGGWDEDFDPLDGDGDGSSLSECMLSYQSNWESGIDSTYYCNGNNTTHSCGVNYQLWRNNRTISTTCNESNPDNCIIR